MRPLHFLSALALLTAACAGSQPSSPAAPGAHDPFSRCEGRQACRDSVQARVIAESGGRVRRQGDRLVIQVERGAPAELVDNTSDSGDARRHAYAGYLPSIRHHVVQVGYYEGGDVILVNAVTGMATTVHGYPAIAPGGGRIATASVDLVAGHDENTIQIWRVMDTHLELEWEVRGGNRWGASHPAWRGDDVVQFTHHRLPSWDSSPDDIVQTPMRIVLREGGFSLEPDRR